MLELNSIWFRYPGSSHQVFEDFSLTVNQGDFVSVIGSSGCGKSTLLSIIAGILRPQRGRVIYHGKEVMGPANSRVLIFQDHLLFPWKTAIQNIEFVLKAKGVKRQNRRGQALDFLRLVKLDTYADAYPKQLSLGMQQRIGIARAFAADPDLVLLDEPFSSVDLITKNDIINELKPLAKSLNKTLILVTHNLEEAFYLGERAYLMSKGPCRIINTFDLPKTKSNLLFALENSPQYISFKESISTQMRV